jgi:hypothetical protein
MVQSRLMSEARVSDDGLIWSEATAECAHREVGQAMQVLGADAGGDAGHPAGKRHLLEGGIAGALANATHRDVAGLGSGTKCRQADGRGEAQIIVGVHAQLHKTAVGQELAHTLCRLTREPPPGAVGQA